MRPRTRLWLCLAVIIFSALYGLLVTQAPELAHALITGYVALVLTIFVLCEVWQRHE